MKAETPAQDWKRSVIKSLSVALKAVDVAVQHAPVLGPLRAEVLWLRNVLVQRRAPRLRIHASNETVLNGLIEVIFGAEQAIPLSQTLQRYAWGRLPLSQGKVDGWLSVQNGNLDLSMAGVRKADAILIVALHGDPRAKAMAQELRQLKKDSHATHLYMVTARSICVCAEPERAEKKAVMSWKKLKRDRSQAAFSFEVCIVCGQGGKELSEALLENLPEESKLEAGRAFQYAQQARKRFAERIVKSCAEISTRVALTPIPFSDGLILIPLQASMVSALAYLNGETKGRETTLKWLASLGAAGVAGMGMRWSARQVIKFIPFAGSVISSSIAGAGTTAIGKSAERYFEKKS